MRSRPMEPTPQLLVPLRPAPRAPWRASERGCPLTPEPPPLPRDAVGPLSYPCPAACVPSISCFLHRVACNPQGPIHLFVFSFASSEVAGIDEIHRKYAGTGRSLGHPVPLDGWHSGTNGTDFKVSRGGKKKRSLSSSLGLCKRLTRAQTPHSLVDGHPNSTPPCLPTEKAHLVVELAPAPAAVAAATRGRGRCLLGLGAWPGRCSSSSSSSVPLQRRRLLLQVHPATPRSSGFVSEDSNACSYHLSGMELCNRIDRAA
jgi:hypothetical protein